MNGVSIELLPDSTRAKLRSTQILTSLPQIVSELLQNSLDAGAHHVDIGIDCEEWSLWVKDDGHGMNKDSLSILGQGSEEGRYGMWPCFRLLSIMRESSRIGSSKAYAPDSLDVLSTFGFRGEGSALPSDTCVLTMLIYAAAEQPWPQRLISVAWKYPQEHQDRVRPGQLFSK